MDGDTLVSGDGKEVGVMTGDSFVVNPSSLFNSYSEITLELYFASEDGQSLIREDRYVHYLNSVLPQKLIVEELIKGPQEDGEKNAVPKETKVISVTVTDGVCYVNLDDGFLIQNSSVSEETVIYSIVNSLFAYGEIESVRISVNGESDLVYRDTINLDQNFYAKPSLISGKAKSTKTSENGSETGDIK